MDKNKRILVTGAAGLAGRWILARLSASGYRHIFCTDMSTSLVPSTSGSTETAERMQNSRDTGGANAASLGAVDAIGTWSMGDICDSHFTNGLFRDVRPDYVFHFAGLLGNADPSKLITVNKGGTERVLSAIVSNKLTQTRVLVTSSSAVYGDKGTTPVSEELPLAGTSSYSISKIEQEKTALDFHSTYGIPVIVSRAFNNIAPGERDSMFVSRIAIQIVRIEKGLERILRIGPLHSYRDYLDTRDLVDAYIALMAKGAPGEIYNACSGEAFFIEELFQILIGHANVPIEYEIINYDQSGNIPYQRGSDKKLRDQTGWKKTRDIRKTVIEILEYWRAVIR